MDTAILAHSTPGLRVSGLTRCQKPQAFEKRLGIWNYKKTRRRYLLRLRKEGKTVYSARNTYFVTRIQKADEIDLFKFEVRFVRV